jgi:hypothetical protein
MGWPPPSLGDATSRPKSLPRNIPGLTKDAQIAFSAIFSVVDPEVSHDDSDSEADDDRFLHLTGKDTPYDEDLTSGLGLGCGGECSLRFLDCWSQPLYLCLTCVDVRLCEACYTKRIAQNKGEACSHWRTYCGPNHEYLGGPIDGWSGVRGGIMTIGESKVKFADWLKDVEKRWSKVKLGRKS